jgi:hypothetical protein
LKFWQSLVDPRSASPIGLGYLKEKMDSRTSFGLLRKLFAVALLLAAFQLVGVQRAGAITFTPVFTFDPAISSAVQQQQQQATNEALANFAKYFQPSRINVRVVFSFKTSATPVLWARAARPGSISGIAFISPRRSLIFSPTTI